MERRHRSLYVFRRDLRLEDHAGVAAAARAGDVVPALVLEPHVERALERNPRRAAYYCAAAAALRDALAAAGETLPCRRGPFASAVLRLARETRADAVGWAASYDAATIERDRAAQAVLEEAGFRVALAHAAPAVAPDETAAARTHDGGLGYRSFRAFLAAWAAQPRAPLGIVRPRFARADVRSDPFPVPAAFGAAAGGSESEPTGPAVLATFERYLAGPALAYRSAQSVPADGPTSRLSAALSFGVVSARDVLARIDARRRDRFLLSEERASLDALTRSFARRDFFLQLGWFYETSPDLALQERMRRFPFAREHTALERWRTGRTGYPLVDAGMRQLLATGWMHPRVRLVAASFLCFDLGVDWRVGRDAWDALLVEDDAALATGNWQWVAGVGADLAQFPRIFNPRRQARHLDPSGTYVRRWVPELAGMPDSAVLDPPSARRRRQLALPLFDGAAYPAPAVDHEREARAFLARYAAHVRAAVPRGERRP